MTTAQTLHIDSTSLNKTLEYATQIGRKLRGGEVIELISDLGGGKTAFVRGLARGMGSHDTVHSPSFTLSNQYQAGAMALYHFDFYRLAEPGIMRDELAEALNDSQSVVAIEWADSVEDILPFSRVSVRIKPTSENDRHITIEWPLELGYLFPINT